MHELTISLMKATQVIHTIAKASFPQIQEIMRNNDDEESQAYSTLKSLFEQTRKVYSRESPFIDAIAIQMFQINQQEVIRKANIATFLSSILGAHDVSFFHLNEFFMETFVPLGHRLLKWQGAVYLELKTQTYISALMNSDGAPDAMLDELFPPDLDAQILTRHPDAPTLSPSEQDFIDRSRARKSYLLAEESTPEALQELTKKYAWPDFVREFAMNISKNVDGIMNVPSKSQSGAGGSSSDKRNSTVTQSFDALSGRPNRQSISGLNPITASNSSRDDSAKKPTPAASTVRQPWTKPEEDALVSGLEKVNGPHWSQILALYGRGGSISEILKDRNQVQLKDKARNLKLWYLKMGKEVPQALRGVTGELRKRGGARARAALGADDEDGDAEGEEEGAATAKGKRRSKKGS
jgi:protein TBF1